MSTTKEPPQQASYSDTNNRFPSPPGYAEKAFKRFHQHTISDSTATSISNDSSPTTTCSTVDDSSATEPSPGSSPESPPPSSFAVGMLRPRTAEENCNPFFELQKPAPPKKGRNMKNLAVNTMRHPARAASTTSLPIETQTVDSATAGGMLSPSFVKPPSPPKRKPSNLGLTILTPATTNPAPQQIRLTIPPTPGFGRPQALRHFQSSPSLPLFPAFGLETHFAEKINKTTLDTIVSPILPHQAVIKEDDEQNFDIPLSQEVKPEAYPDGPICVYDPHVDLYLEPTAEEARKYDVIINVASEVRNPLVSTAEPLESEPEVRLDGGGGIQYAPKRERSLVPNATELELNQSSSPTTPKATPLNTTFPQGIQVPTERNPEYIHVPWEHNSDIVPDLLNLVKTIDEKVIQGKRVLVHCQCGVSRSASLVVAYGLYKEPTMSVQEAYDAVKAKSKWIGPNMNLIMQLQEFRTCLTRGGRLPSNRGMSPITPTSALSEWAGPFSARSIQSSLNAGPASAGIAPSSPIVPNEELSAVSPGPSSAPSGMPWPKESSKAVKPLHLQPLQKTYPSSTVRTNSAYVDPSGHVIPVLKVVEPQGEIKTQTLVMPTLSPKDDDSVTPTEAIASPRSSEFAMTALQPPTNVDSADDYGIMSPTSSEFPSSAFDRSALLAQLGMGSVRPQMDLPLRSKSLRSRNALSTPPSRGLPKKISSPSLREQQQLKTLQADIESRLPNRQINEAAPNDFGDALMSPRATEFTENPFALAMADVAPVPSVDLAPRALAVDPRSPAQKGASPITRNIEDVL